MNKRSEVFIYFERSKITGRDKVVFSSEKMATSGPAAEYHIRDQQKSKWIDIDIPDDLTARLDEIEAKQIELTREQLLQQLAELDEKQDKLNEVAA